jgi:hypothetical protein
MEPEDLYQKGLRPRGIMINYICSIRASHSAPTGHFGTSQDQFDDSLRRSHQIAHTVMGAIPTVMPKVAVCGQVRRL